MNQRPKKWSVSSSSSSSSSGGFSFSFPASSTSATLPGGRGLIFAKQRIGDAVDTTPTPRRIAVAAVQILNVTHGRRHATNGALRPAIRGRTRALQKSPNGNRDRREKDYEFHDEKPRHPNSVSFPHDSDENGVYPGFEVKLSVD